MRKRLPEWFKKDFPDASVMRDMRAMLTELGLHTICESALCPNIGECFLRRTATFLILGDVCTRRCTFCAVKKGVPLAVDGEEPQHICEAVEMLGLRYVVLTSVTRDDLSDGGAGHFARTIHLLHGVGTGVKVEVLVPDFQGLREAIGAVIESEPEVLNHNLETVPRLYEEVRPIADYERSLELLREVKRQDGTMVTKSGLMVGLGESKEEIIGVMEDLRGAQCDLLTIGQYLQPSLGHHPVVEFILPEMFLEYEERAKELGFLGVASGPYVRSSYKAGELYRQAIEKRSGQHAVERA